MKERSLLLAGLVEEDDFEETRQRVSEDYEAQFEDDVKNISENVHFVEEDEIRLKRLIGESEEVDTWEAGKRALDEGADDTVTMGGVGPGFASFQGQSTGFAKAGSPSNYVPSLEDTYNAIIGGHRSYDQWQEVEDPRSRLFNKISEMSSAAYDQDREPLKEDELPVFDQDFRPLNNESDDGNFFDEFTEGLSSKADELREKIENGEYAVQGGIGPGFSAYDGPKEIKNPYDKADQTMSKWFLPESMMSDECSTETIEEEDYFQEPQDDFWAGYDEQEAMEPPDRVDLANVSLIYGGDTSDGEMIYKADGDDETFLVSGDPQEGYYASISDPFMGLAGEGQGETIEAALQSVYDDYAGEQTVASPMMEGKKGKKATLFENRDEGQSSNAWYYRRTGMTDGYHLKPRPSNGSVGDETKMHADHPEEPSHEGHPGLPGWSFYTADRTYQKMRARDEDPLEEGEKVAVEEELQKFFKKYSVYE